MLSLKEAYESFLEDRRCYCTSATVNNYSNNLRYFCQFMEEKYSCDSSLIDINQISVNDLKEYVIMLRNRKKNSTHTFKPSENIVIRSRSVRTYSIDMRTFFNYLFDNRMIDSDLMHNFHIIKEETVVILPVTEEEVFEIDTLFDVEEYLGLRNYLLFHLMLDCGMRSGEVLGLKRKDVNLDNKYFIVCGKGNKERFVPLPPRLLPYLQLYLAYDEKEAADGSLFCSYYGEHSCTKNTVKCLFAQIRKATGIKRLKPHLLRHTFATSFILAGGDVTVLKEYLGHYDISVTQKYIHIANSMMIMKYPIYKLDTALLKYSAYHY